MPTLMQPGRRAGVPTKITATSWKSGDKLKNDFLSPGPQETRGLEQQQRLCLARAELVVAVQMRKDDVVGLSACSADLLIRFCFQNSRLFRWDSSLTCDYPL